MLQVTGLDFNLESYLLEFLPSGVCKRESAVESILSQADCKNSDLVGH